jgi:hypothetical protein
MRAEKPAGVRYGTEALALGGFTKVLPKRAGEERGGIQLLFLISPAGSGDRSSCGADQG